jgi:tetrapyrrole methylase family protein/MazG family protein/ATP diphosphatase
MNDARAKPAIERLIEVMARLRSPDGGCPWDIEQTFRTIAPYTIEEAYEVADAVSRDDLSALREELGDLLFQVVFHARMAEEAGIFRFDDVVDAIVAKMEARHPHVFGEAKLRTADEQTLAWESHKAAERSNKGAASLLDDVPLALPGMTRAVKLQRRAARVGFDWTDARDVLDKLHEEIEELAEAAKSEDADAIEDEFGDLLFVMANLSRHLKVDPEAAVRRTNEKFARRFRHIERRLAGEGRDIAKTALADMEELWTEAKLMERTPK